MGEAMAGAAAGVMDATQAALDVRPGVPSATGVSGVPGVTEPGEEQVQPAGATEAQPAGKRALSDEEKAALRKHGRPRGYTFGGRAAQNIEGASLSGSKEERERSQAERTRDERMEQAARAQVWQAKLAGMSYQERLDATMECLGRRASFSRILHATLEFCRTERDSDEVEAFIERQGDFAANRQSARRYVLFLLRTGAIEETGYDAAGNPVVRTSDVPVEDEPAPGPAEGKPAGEPAPAVPAGSVELTADQGFTPAVADGDASVQESAPAVSDGTAEVVAPADGAPAQEPSEVPVADLAAGAPASEPSSEPVAPAPDATPGTPAPAPEPPVAWRIVTTDVGRAALEAHDPRVRLRALLQEQGPTRYETYLQLLTFCEEPRTLEQISTFLIGNPGLEIDDRGIVHMQPNAYIGKLDAVGALEWDGGWRTTEGAREVLNEQ